MATILVNPYYVSGGGGGGSSTLLTGLVSWWDLDTDGTDDHASNDMASRGTPSFGTVGGRACVTTSTTDHLYCASPTGVDLSTFTLAAWIYRSTTSTAEQILGATHNNGQVANHRYMLRADSTRGDLLLSDGSTLANLDTTAGTLGTTSQWYLLIGTYDGSTGDMNLYIDDGTNTANGSSGYTALSGSFGIGIGGDGDGTGSGTEFTGSIQRCAIWSRVITSDERTELWNSGSGISYADL